MRVPQIPKNQLMLIAGLVWCAAGAMVVMIGLPLEFQLAPEHLVLLPLAGVVFLAFYFLVFSQLVRKHTGRIRARTEDRLPVWDFFNASSWVVMAVMMGGGMALRVLAPDAGLDDRLLLQRSRRGAVPVRRSLPGRLRAQGRARPRTRAAPLRRADGARTAGDAFDRVYEGSGPTRLELGSRPEGRLPSLTCAGGRPARAPVRSGLGCGSLGSRLGDSLQGLVGHVDGLDVATELGELAGDQRPPRRPWPGRRRPPCHRPAPRRCGPCPRSSCRGPCGGRPRGPRRRPRRPAASGAPRSRGRGRCRRPSPCCASPSCWS